ncbi:MAG: cytochrome C, partial [Chlorobi bacterium]|nr:cytochrome C [Chlorobiota bacterium]
EYRWFNGTADHYLLGDKVDTLEPIKINTLLGSYADKNSKIIPVKIHRAKQIYDPVTKLLVQPKLWDAEKGNGALWVDCKKIPKDSIWGIAAKAGMDYLNLPFSGEYTFAKTEMSWPINHMVAEKENTLKCQDCHTRNDGRLEGLEGFYMPGRDYNAALDIIGLLMILGTFGGVSLHAGLRILAWRKRKKIAEGGE